MYKILIIGAGQLGSRHLQGLLKIELPIHIEIFDISESSLNLAKNRANEIENNINIVSIKYINNLKKVSTRFDLVIIATTSSHRYSILSELTKNCNFSNIVLEKILFQKESEYELANEIFIENGIKCWINCPRRLYTIYNDIKKMISKKEKIEITISGKDWGLACNSIHFIDLFNYMTDNVNFSFNCEGISEIIPSKRNNYFEFEGKYSLRDNFMNTLNMESKKDNTLDFLITIETDSFIFNVDELNNKATFYNKKKLQFEKEMKFNLPYQSELTNLFSLDILTTGHCNLPSYKNTYKYHKDMIAVFTDVFYKYQMIKHCQIT